MSALIIPYFLKSKNCLLKKIPRMKFFFLQEVSFLKVMYLFLRGRAFLKYLVQGHPQMTLSTLFVLTAMEPLPTQE